MKKAINLYVSEIDTLDKINWIKEAGFEAIYTGMYNNPETIELNKIIEIFKKNNFGIPQMHCSYIEPKLKDLWFTGESGDDQEKFLLSQIDETAKYDIKNFVIHTNGEYNPPITNYGIKRIKRLLERCKEYDINLCIENLYSYKQMRFIFDNIEDDNLKVCYDCGHDNCLKTEQPIFEAFKDKITVLHLHDNHGKPKKGIGDEHLMLGLGNMDLNKLAEKLSTLPEDIVLCAEYKVSPENCNKEYFIKSKQSLDMLEKMIAMHRNCNLNDINL